MSSNIMGQRVQFEDVLYIEVEPSEVCAGGF